MKIERTTVPCPVVPAQEGSAASSNSIVWARNRASSPQSVVSVRMPRHGDDSVEVQQQQQQHQQQGSGCWSYESRWLCLATGCAMQVCAGAVYSFGSVAEDMKHNLELHDAHEQGLISIAGNLGLWVGSFTGGILADARGPRVSMLGGAVLFFVGYGAMYLALSHRVNALRDPTIVAFFYLLAGLGSGWVMNSVRTIAADTSVVSLDCSVCCRSAETSAAYLRLHRRCSRTRRTGNRLAGQRLFRFSRR
eukprot:COSAG02_NODE_2076_length_9917_cov_906.312589_6_plen_249_part_00